MIQHLEPRRLLSGNVSVVADANLNSFLTGDKKDNRIQITLAPGVGYNITGLKGTTINGHPAVAIQTSLALRFVVNMGKGKDQVVFAGAFGTRDLEINTGDGDDTVALSGGVYFGNVKIDTGKGKDSLILSSIQVTQDLSVNTGSGKDTINIATPVQVGGNASLDGGTSKNVISGQGNVQTPNGATVVLGKVSNKGKENKAKDAVDDQDKDGGKKDD